MKARTIALVLLVTAVTSWAQTAPPSQQIAPADKSAKQTKSASAPAPAASAAKPAPAKTAKPAQAKSTKAAPATAAKPAASKVTKAAPASAAKPAVSKVTKAAPATAAKPVASKATKAAPARGAKPAARKAAKPAVKKAKPAAIKTAAPKPAETVAQAKSAPRHKRDPFVSPIVRAEGNAGCATGKKCLVIDNIVLKGIVKSQVGMIAVVEGSNRRLSYFLRENDPVFNGYVVKISMDSIVFRENIMDPLGRQSTREVVKKVAAPVV